MAHPLQQLPNLDIHTFRILSVVYRERSFTRAAEQLNLSQSVISYAIDKLRQTFDDTLFVREGGETLATERCEAVVTYANGILMDFQTLLTSGQFDPETTTKRLVIACNYYERTLMIPHIVSALKERAPLIEIEIIDASAMGHERLLKREADLLIGPYQRQDTSLYCRTLSTDHYVCMLDPNHPLADSTMSLEQYLSLEHILITYGGRWKSRYISELETLGHRIVPAIRLPSPAGTEELVKGSRLVATMPELLARKLGKDLCIVPCPVPAPISIQLVWVSTMHRSEMSRWVRNVISEVVSTA